MSKFPLSPLLLSALLVLCVPPAASAAEYFLSPASEASELGGSEGYMLLYVDAGGSAPSFEYTRIAGAGNQPLQAGERYRFASSSAHKVSLKGLGEGFYLLPMRKGQYQITEVNAPHYSFPFRMDTDNRPEWRFIIEPGKTNFIGALHIQEERSASHVEINLLNRVAMHEAGIREAMGETLKTYPLSFYAGYRDDFFSTGYLNAEEGEESQEVAQ